VTAPLVSAIPDHLVVERTRPRRGREGVTPPYPSFSARFRPSVRRVVMAYYGVQHRDDAPDALRRAARDRLAGLRTTLGSTDGAGSLDRATYVDEAGYRTELLIAYWDEPERYDRWCRSTPSWTDPSGAVRGLGFFAEVLRPSVERYETLFSNDRLEGIGRLADGLSGEVFDHAYWGGARDRLPLAQTDDLDPEGEPASTWRGSRARVVGQHNLCLIRSGQDWTETEGEERAMYTDDVEPVLRAGMDFLRDEGLSVGCYANRYVRVCDDDGQPIDKSFGMSWWRSLADLDAWAASHPTHLEIFGAAMRYLGKLGPAARLRLYHEVTVAAADEQSFEYLDCHDRTGLLRVGATVDTGAPGHAR
jgi:aldoxime dehydratase